MSTKFTASNGVEIETSEDGYLRGNKHIHPGVLYATAGPDGVEALREFFQHERDQELNRWRDPDNPDLVVYRRPEEDDYDGRAVAVLDDSTGVAFTYWEKYGLDGQGVTRYEKGQEAAGRYFAAHPETKPWDEAEPGEAWVLTIDGSEEAAMLMYSYDSDTHEFYIGSSDSLYSRSDPSITAGRRIWPEEGHTK